MITHRHISSGKILETIIGVILFAVAIGMRLAPPAIRDESGAAYITVAFLLIIGSWLLFNALFEGSGSHSQKG